MAVARGTGLSDGVVVEASAVLRRPMGYGKFKRV
jgi:hypothetical protein